MDRSNLISNERRQHLQRLGLASKEKKSKNEENISREHYNPIGFLNSELNNNSSLQIHLCAENGQISYKPLDFGNHQNKRANLQSTSDLINLQTLTALEELAQAMAPSNRTTSKVRKQTPSKIPTQLNHENGSTKTTSNSNTNNNAEKRSKHNEIERKRRDKINNWIIKLSKIVPDCQDESTKQSQSKGVILSKACDYITDLSKSNNKLANAHEENIRLKKELTEIKKEKNELSKENERLKNLLKDNNIEIKEARGKK